MPNRTFEIAPPQHGRAFAIFSEPSDMAKYIREGGQICFDASNHTTTTLNTSFSGGELSFNLNLEVEGFKTAEKSMLSFATYERTFHHYFKLSKKQSKDQYIEYVKHLVSKIEDMLGVKITQEHFLIHTSVFKA